jgi:hypothetical protein
LKNIEEIKNIHELVVDYRDNIFYGLCFYLISSIFAFGLNFYNESKYQISSTRRTEDFNTILFFSTSILSIIFGFLMFGYFLNDNTFIKNINFIHSFFYLSLALAFIYFFLICLSNDLGKAIKGFKNKDNIDSLKVNIQILNEKIINLEKLITNDPAILCDIADQVKDHVYEENEKIEIKYLFDIVQKREKKKKENIALSESLHETIKDKFETENSKILNL